MSLPHVNRAGEVIEQKFSVDEYILNRNIQEVISLIKDAKLLAFERDQFALSGVIDMIDGCFGVIVKIIDPIRHKQKEQYHAL